jgi:hypothetical protein
MQQQGGGQGGWLGTVSSLASQFLQRKLDDQSPEDATNYVAPAEQAGVLNIIIIICPILNVEIYLNQYWAILRF